MFKLLLLGALIYEKYIDEIIRKEYPDMSYKIVESGCLIFCNGCIVAETPTEEEAIAFIKEHS